MSSNGVIKLILLPLQVVLLCLVWIYRYIASPILHMLAPGSGCRFQPTCSEYAQQAILRHGPAKGSWLALKRISRCHPWGGHGYDPVPDGCSCTRQKDDQHPTSFESPLPDGNSSHS